MTNNPAMATADSGKNDISGRNRPVRAPWIEPAPRATGLILFWLGMVAMVGAIASVVSTVGFEDSGSVHGSAGMAPTTTSAPPGPVVDELDALLNILGISGDRREQIRSEEIPDQAGDPEAESHEGQPASPPDSAGRIDVIRLGAFRFESDEAGALAFSSAGRLACGTLGSEQGTDYVVTCTREAPGEGLAASGPVFVVWANTRLDLASTGSGGTLCVGSIDAGVEAAISFQDQQEVRTLEIQVRGGVDPRSIRLVKVGNTWAFLVPAGMPVPSWRLTGTQVTQVTVTADTTAGGGPPPQPNRAKSCTALELSPEELLNPPTTTTTSMPETTTTGTAPTTVPPSTEATSTTAPATTAPVPSTAPTSAPASP